MIKKIIRVIPGLTRNLLNFGKIPAFAGMTLTMLILFSTSAFAQDSTQVEMADEMRASGKIYVVVAVLSIVFIGIVIYLIRLDRKISKLEKESAGKK